MEKENKVLVGLVLFLTACVIALGGFLLYDKVLDKKEPEVKELEKDNNSPTPQTPVKEDHSVILNGGWYQNDADAIKIDYNSVKTETYINGLHIKYECAKEDAEEDAPTECANKYTINNKIIFYNTYPEIIRYIVLSYKDYVIILKHDDDVVGMITIYNKTTGQEVKTVATRSKKDRKEPVVHSGKLYYLHESEGKISYIDLTSSNLIETIVK